MSLDESALYFSLGSVDWHYAIMSREGVDLIPYVSTHNLTPEKYQQLHDWWWFNPDAELILNKLKKSFIESISISLFQSCGGYDWEKFLYELDSTGAWSDFIREIYECQAGDTDYFLEYCVDQFLLIEIDEEAALFENEDEDDEDEYSDQGPGLEEVREGFLDWYESSELEIKELFMDVSTLIKSSGILLD